MLYLEDYLEMIEHLPSELRDRFTEMREMDLSVQNRVDSLENRQKVFFNSCKRLKSTERDDEYNKIRKEYEKVIEDSSEKIQNAEDCYNLVDKYLRKLDQELHKFKLELEADHRGITEILEKRSLEMDAPSTNSTSKENRLPKKHIRKNQTIAHPTSSSSSSTSSLAVGGSLDSRIQPGKSSDIRKSSFVFPEGIQGIDAVASTSGMVANAAGNTTYPLQHMGAGGNAIAAAASQAIAATQQLVPGRRTSSLKASYEAINLGVQAHEFSIGRELAGAAQSALAATSIAGGEPQPPVKRTKISKRSSSQVDPGTPQPGLLDVVNSGSLLDDSLLDGALVGSPADDLFGGAGTSREGGEQEWNYDPNEPRYCVCNQVSYGDMVACDNVDCPYEWFHYPCVGITAPPKGKWYCPTCLARRKARK